MNRIQRKDRRIGTNEINKISLSCFDDKIYIQSNGCDELVISRKYSEKPFCQVNYFDFKSNQDSFFVMHIKFEKRKISEELMPIAWHPKKKVELEFLHVRR